MIKHTSVLSLIATLLLLSSCSSTYYWSSLASANYDVEQVENGDFLIDEDNLWIAYNFNGENAPVKITIFNKMDKPLYVDWSRSAMSINNEAVSYATNYSTDVIHYNQWGGSFLIDKVEKSNSISFIPPKSMIQQIPITLAGLSFEDMPKDSFVKGKMQGKDGILSINRVNFTEKVSPLKLKSYLTLYTDNRDNPMIFEQEFYLKSLIKSTSLSPRSMPGEMVERGDLFFIEKLPNTTGLEIMAVTGIVVGAVAVDVMINDY